MENTLLEQEIMEKLADHIKILKDERKIDIESDCVLVKSEVVQRYGLEHAKSLYNLFVKERDEVIKKIEELKSSRQNILQELEDKFEGQISNIKKQYNDLTLNELIGWKKTQIKLGFSTRYTYPLLKLEDELKTKNIMVDEWSICKDVC
jgi:hypothetical protein